MTVALGSASFWNSVSAVGVLMLVAYLVITDKLVWHTRLKKETERADRWERVALEAMATGATASVKAAEVTAEVIASLPDPARSTPQRKV